MYCISICDDEQRMRDRIESLVRGYFTERNIEYSLRTFSSGEELCRYKGHTDIVFLDVEMKNLNGIQTGYSLIRKNPDTIIFIVTSHREYLDEAMDLRVFRFIDKPVDKTRLYSALNIITEQSDELTFMSNHLPITLRAREVVCIYSCERKTFVLTDTGVYYPTILNVKEWMEKIEDIPCFSRPHYSYIINMKYVSRIDGRNIVMKLKNGKSFSVEASQRKITGFKNDFVSVMRCR